LHLSLQRSRVPGTIVRAFDWDQAACQVYAANYGSEIVKKIDISTLSVDDLAALRADLWLLSPSCQPYTVINPLAKGSADPRAESFLHIIEKVLPKLVSARQHPRYLLVENVAGFENSSTRQLLLSTLRSLGYTTIELLLTPLQFAIPNSRMRYYMLAKAKPLSFSCPCVPCDDNIWRYIPGHICGDGGKWVDPRSLNDPDTTSTDELYGYLDANVHLELPHPHAIPDRVLVKWGRLFDIVLPSSRRSCCFTRGYTQLVERAGSILQMNEVLDASIVFDTFSQALSKGNANAAHILDPLRLRYFSPSELLRLLHFDAPSEGSHMSINVQQPFLWPEGVSMKTKYRLIGNSVNVKVVTALIDFLFEEGLST